MINFDSDQNSDLQIVDGNFTINSGSNDPSAFFNMNSSNTTFLNNQTGFNNQSNSPNFTGGFGSTNFFNSSNRNDQIVTPNPPPSQATTQGSQCSGNCGACVWSFLCKKAATKLSSLGGCVPKLG
ncbi:hypothetical protein M9Y10_010463 [Tritrichomonas musculus]|uniref:Uncharacterized protein n=1 Tax=Tritrichomonas musculus TaxID=1915356 RepID=A0ABR2IKS0_9EUKA